MQGPKHPRGYTFPKPPAGTPPAGTGVRSIHRTAGYGPVCPVVWEGGAVRLPLSRSIIGCAAGPARAMKLPRSAAHRNKRSQALRLAGAVMTAAVAIIFLIIGV